MTDKHAYMKTCQSTSRLDSCSHKVSNNIQTILLRVCFILEQRVDEKMFSL